MRRIAVSTDGDRVSAHFGRCSFYTIIDLEDGEIIGQRTLENPGHEPGFLPQFLHQNGVHAIVAGGMGPRAQSLFQAVGIDCYLGIDGPIDAVIEKIKKGSLVGGESTCDHENGKKSADYDHEPAE